MLPWKRKLILQTIIFRFYANPWQYIPLIVLANWVIICYRSHPLREPGFPPLNLCEKLWGGSYPYPPIRRRLWLHQVLSLRPRPQRPRPREDFAAFWAAKKTPCNRRRCFVAFSVFIHSPQKDEQLEPEQRWG